MDNYNFSKSLYQQQKAIEQLRYAQLMNAKAYAKDISTAQSIKQDDNILLLIEEDV